MKGKVSIIVPVYNVKDYIEKCVESILKQTYSNIEIILVNDGSIDGSGEICDNYSQKDSRISVIHQQNAGLSAARNAGLAIIKGEFVLFVDSDDYIEANSIELLLCSIVEYNADIVIGNRFLDTDTESKIEDRYLGASNTKHKLVLSSEEAVKCLLSWKYFDMSACGRLFRREVLELNVFPVGKKCEDQYVMASIIAKAKIVIFDPKPIYHYYQRIGSITNDMMVKDDTIQASLNQLKFVTENFPSLRDEANTAYVFSYLEVYNRYLQLRISIDNIIEQEYRKEVACLFKNVIRNKNIGIRRKGQVTLFIICPRLYAFVYDKIKLNKQTC